MIGSGALGQFALGQAQHPEDGSLHPSLVTNTNTFYAPTVIQEQFIVAPLIENASVFYAPSIPQIIQPETIAGSQRFYRTTVWLGAFENSESWVERSENSESWTRRIVEAA